MSETNHGTSGEIELTEEQLEALVEEAEHGYDTDRLRTRSRRGRPALGSEAATVFHVRLPPRLRQALEEAADAEETTPSDILRQALAEYLVRNAKGRRDAS